MANTKKTTTTTKKTTTRKPRAKKTTTKKVTTPEMPKEMAAWPFPVSPDEGVKEEPKKSWWSWLLFWK